LSFKPRSKLIIAGGSDTSFRESQFGDVICLGKLLLSARGLRNTVKDYEAGILVPPRNIDTLAEAIIKMITDRELRERLSANAISQSKNFDWDRTSHRMLTNLRSAVNSKSEKIPFGT